MSSNRSSASRRAALRAQQEAEARRKRTNRVLIAVFSVLAVVIVGIVGFVVIQEMVKTTKGGAQLTPTNATADFGIKTFPTVTPKQGAPKIVIWEDFQCHWCKTTSDTYSRAITELAKKGEITLEYRLVPMLDEGTGAEWSLKAAMGAAIADQFGKFLEYTHEVYANQPSQGRGAFTDKLLRDDIPAKIGLNGAELAQFKAHYDNRATEKFVKQTFEKYKEARGQGKVAGTPTVWTNGNMVDMWARTDTGQTVPVVQPTEEGVLAYFKQRG